MKEKELLIKYPILSKVAPGGHNAVTNVEDQYDGAARYPALETPLTVKLTTANGKLSYEFSAATGAEAFEKIAWMREMFEAVAGVCGACKSRALRCEVSGNIVAGKTYRLTCKSCEASLRLNRGGDGGSLHPSREGWRRVGEE